MAAGCNPVEESSTLSFYSKTKKGEKDMNEDERRKRRNHREDAEIAGKQAMLIVWITLLAIFVVSCSFSEHGFF